MTLHGGLGAAVIGSGFIGTVHVEALRRIGVPVYGLLGSSPARSAAAAARLGVANSYAGLDELLADERVAVVHVASPNALHHPQVAAILGAGRHVVCEKPLAMDSEQSGELVRLAARTGLVNAVNFNLRFYPLNQHLAGEVHDGALGEVRLLTGRYFQDWLLHESDWNWRLDRRTGGGLRAVSDIGSHWLDLLSFISGRRIQEVMAELVTFVPVRRQPSGPVETFAAERVGETVPRAIETEDAATILLRFEGGAHGSLTVSQVSPGRKNSLTYEVDGSLASAAWDSERPDELWIGHRERPNEVLQRDPALMNGPGKAAVRLPGGHVEGFADTFAALYRAVYADVDIGTPSKTPTYATFADGHDEMLVGEAIAASARTGRWIAVNRSPSASPSDISAATGTEEQ